MKGIICEQINELIISDMEEPVSKEGEAIIRIRRIGICGTDMHAYKGNQPFFTYPRVLGHELAGSIEEIRDNPYGFSKGDQVAVIPYIVCGTCIACRKGKTNCCIDMKVLGVHIDGGMRELISVPITHLIKRENLSLDQLAVLEPLSIGAHAVRRSEPHSDEVVLVIGAGPIGLAVMAFAKYSGLKVIAMDINDERLQFCQSWAKVDHIVNATNKPREQLASITNGDYPTIVFDATGNVASMENSFQYVAHGGKLVYVGLVKSDISFADPEFHKREMTLISSRNATREDFETVIDAINSGKIHVEEYITHRADFSHMIEHFHAWLKPTSHVIKAMVDIN